MDYFRSLRLWLRVILSYDDIIKHKKNLLWPKHLYYQNENINYCNSLKNDFGKRIRNISVMGHNVLAVNIA